MAESRIDARRGFIVLAAVVAAALIGLGALPAVAQVSAVKGGAFGYSSSITLFDSPPFVSGPAPTVTLAANASNSPEDATQPSASIVGGPATFFTSGQLDVHTEGTIGATGSAASSTRIQDITDANGEIFRASDMRSTCTASESGASGSTTVTGGVVTTDSGDGTPGHPPVEMPIPPNPALNTVITGHLHVGSGQENFTITFNEQVTNPDDSLTVYAAHERLMGPIAVGNVFLGKAECGVTSTTPPTTMVGPTTTGGPTTTAGPTTTVSPTTVPSDTTSTTTPGGGGVNDVSGGAYGFYTSISLFGGPAATRGPEPSVELPPGGSATPITASAPTGSGVYGPATIFTSDQLDVSTQGTTGPDGSVTSSANVKNVGDPADDTGEVLSAGAISSTCTASATGESGSATFTNGKLIVSMGANPDDAADDTVVQIPANPAPNTSYDGKLETVGDTFRVVVNEQTSSAGSITVNGAHMSLLGPAAVGDLIIGQVRCATTAAGSGGTGTGAGGPGGGSGGGRVALTGAAAAQWVKLALALILIGTVTNGVGRRRPTGGTYGAGGLP